MPAIATRIGGRASIAGMARFYKSAVRHAVK